MTADTEASEVPEVTFRFQSAHQTFQVLLIKLTVPPARAEPEPMAVIEEMAVMAAIKAAGVHQQEVQARSEQTVKAPMLLTVLKELSLL